MVKSDEEFRADMANQLNRVLSDREAMIREKVKKSLAEERSNQMEEIKNQIQL